MARIITPSPVNDQIMVYDEAGRLIGEYLKTGARIREIVWLDDVPVAVLGTHGGSTHQYVLTDHLGTPRAIVHPGSNAILWRWDLTTSAFGDHAANPDPDGNGVAYTFHLRYPGQYYDEDTGLHYNYFRDYDPSTGRYVQSDPIGLAGGISTYGYVSGSPLLRIDPLGLDDIVVLRSNDPIRPIAISRRDAGIGTASITVHAAPGYFYAFGKELSAQEFYELITEDPGNKAIIEFADEIVLNACRAGQTDENGTNLAQQLADLTGKEVLASDQWVWHPDGRPAFAAPAKGGSSRNGPDLTQRSDFTRFCPGGCK